RAPVLAPWLHLMAGLGEALDGPRIVAHDDPDVARRAPAGRGRILDEHQMDLARARPGVLEPYRATRQRSGNGDRIEAQQRVERGASIELGGRDVSRYVLDHCARSSQIARNLWVVGVFDPLVNGENG